MTRVDDETVVVDDDDEDEELTGKLDHADISESAITHTRFTVLLWSFRSVSTMSDLPDDEECS